MEHLTFSQGMALILLALLVLIGVWLWWDSGEMRRRQKRREAYRRYIADVDAQASLLERNCFWRQK